MELRQLTYFDAVIRHGGFTRAAEQLHVAQPAVSAQIRRLESELGVTLLTRTTRTVGLTHAGELLATRARRVLDEIDAARADADQLASALAGRVRIGAIQALDLFDLPGALAEFSRRYPGVELALRSGPGHRLRDWLHSDEIDLALSPTPPGVNEQFGTHDLFNEELVLVTTPGHRLAREPAVRLSALAGEPFICLPGDSGLRRILDDAAAADGCEVHVPFESTNLLRIRDFASHGLGVALLARSVAQAPGPPVAVHAVAPNPLHRSVGLLQHRKHPLTPAAEACRDSLIAWAGRIGIAGRNESPQSA